MEPSSSGDGYTVTLRVTAAWKGIDQSSVVVTTKDWGMCGYPFEVGAKYLVYAQLGRPFLEVDNCHRTYPLEPGAEYPPQAQRDMAELGQPSVTWKKE
jgi:hypothetical protein